jgi:hypothetical protein
MCFNEHKFHYSIKLIKLNLYRVEVHLGLSDHFTDNCNGCKIISITEKYQLK